VDAPQTRYALRDGLHIGYQIWGDGPIDVLEFNNGLMISVDETSDEPNWNRYEESLASFCRLIRFDAMGLGLSDPFPGGVLPTIDGWANDALAVLEDAGSTRAVALGTGGGALPAAWLAAHHPDLVTSLVMINGSARIMEDDDYPVGIAQELFAAIPHNIENPQPTDEVPMDIAIYVPSLAHRVGFREWWGRAARRGASPSTAMSWNLTIFGADVREDLDAISCPTLIISHEQGFADLVEHGRYLSERITGSRFVTFPGRDIVPWAGEFDSIVDEIEEFVTGQRRGHQAERTLATVLFTDIVDSTVRAAAAGDRQWRSVLDEYDVNVERLLARFDGILVKNTGDGTLARFASPAQGIRCAKAMVDTAQNFEMEIRAGLHAGEIELRGDDIGGLAVHIASRVSALAGHSEVLATGTVRDLVVGSGIVFDDRGRHNLKGIPDEWQLLSVEKA
jgi:class 3 adenylate cyclase